MKAKVFVYALALLSSVASARDRFACDSYFGENLQIITEQMLPIDGKTMADLEKGDFNGDGLKDRVIILRLNKTSKFSNAVTLLNQAAIWPRNRKSGDLPANVDKAHLSIKDTIALGIIQSDGSDKKCHKFVIYNTDYFPSSDAQFLDVRIVPVDDKEFGYADFQKYISQNFGLEELRYDAIHLNSLARMALVYWSNGKYVFNGIPDELFPDEE